MYLVLPALSAAATLDSFTPTPAWPTGEAGVELERPRVGDVGEVGVGLMLFGTWISPESPPWWDTTFGADLSLAFVPVENLAVNVRLPTYPTLLGEGYRGAALGDVDVSLTGALPVDEDSKFGLAFHPSLRVPTGTAKWQLGDADVTGGLEVTGEYAPSEAVWIDLAGGVRAAPTSLVGEEVVGSTAGLGAGVGVAPGGGFSLGAELGWEHLLVGEGANELEGHAWAGWKGESGLGLRLGVGRGFVESASAPELRVFGGISYVHEGEPPVHDHDGDGLDDPNDRCPEAAEDHDGFQDADGCPDPDNDGDGVADAADGCPTDAEDHDGYYDDDGCPEDDNDQDGVKDFVDDCRDVAGSLRAMGCPDRDDDTVADAMDDCPSVAGPATSRGCPPRETVEITPAPATEAVVLHIDGRVNFETATAHLTPDAAAVLQRVVVYLRAHPEIAVLRVEGHTDSDGEDTANLKLSQARADAVVDWLVAHGIDRPRLHAVGKGEAEPVAPNETQAGRAENRRVDFIVEQTRKR